MKTIKSILISTVLFLSAGISAIAVGNRYGMSLSEDSNGQTIIKSAEKYADLGIDLSSLPELLVPYKPVAPCLAPEAFTAVPEDIVYKKGIDGEDLHILLYRSRVQNSPVAFYIHGGGWVAGNNKSYVPFCKTLAGKYGITVVSVEYTLCKVKGSKMEDTINDCFDAVEFVRSRSAEFGIDPDRIAFFGGSAGGHLSAMCALHFPQTKAYAGWYGAYDLEKTMDYYAPEGTKVHSRYDCYLDDWDPRYVSRCSPVKVAEKMKSIGFASYLFTGTADITIGIENAPSFRKALTKRAKAEVTIFTFPNVTHNIHLSYAADDMYSKTIELFTTKL